MAESDLIQERAIQEFRITPGQTEAVQIAVKELQRHLVPDLRMKNTLEIRSGILLTEIQKEPQGLLQRTQI